MKVHEINVRRDSDAFVVTAEKRHELETTYTATVYCGHEKQSETFGHCYRPESMEMVFENPEDVVTAIERLLRDGV